jgi:hypothetical protein
MHQPLIILGVGAAAAAKGVHQREQRAVVLIEQVLFDAPAAPGPAAARCRAG